jgi:hypothetical protein
MPTPELDTSEQAIIDTDTIHYLIAPLSMIGAGSARADATTGRANSKE